MELTSTRSDPRLKRDLGRQAIDRALAGDWERAAQVNRAILELFDSDVDAMNRLGKALMELGQLQGSESTFLKALSIAPYNQIAKKNLERLSHLHKIPAPHKQPRKTAGAPQIFIEDTGKSTTTTLQKPTSGEVFAHIAPGDPVHLVVDKNAIAVKTGDDEYLGQLDLKLGTRLIRLVNGGNKYEAAVVSVGSTGISIIIREAFSHASLRDVISFPTRSKDKHRVYLVENVMRYIEDEELAGVEEEDVDKEVDRAPVMEGEAADSDWKD